MVKIRAKMNQVFRPQDMRLKWVMDDSGRIYPVVKDLSEVVRVEVKRG